MATFEYNALTSSGRLMKGTIEASSPEQASQMLTEMKLTINEISKAKDKGPKTSIGRNEFLLFNQQLASITKAGIPLEKGLRELASDAGSTAMKKLISDVADDLEAGDNIEQAIAKRQKKFPSLYGLILKAGIQTGRLSEMLTSLNRHLEIGIRTRRIIGEAFCYPIVVISIVAIIITFLFSMVIPSFAEILLDMSGGEAQLPHLTNVFITMAENVWQFWGVVLLLLIVVAVIFILLSGSAQGRRFKEAMFLKLPILGRLYHNGILARMAEAMAMLAGAGTDMPTCIRLSAGATGSEKTIQECEILASEIENGSMILEAGQFSRMIPRLFLYSIQLGSQRNELQDNLYSLGEMYTEQTQYLQVRLQSILLPVMIIFLGVIVGLTVLAMFLPMIKMVTVMM
ncbi:MAG: type II secretion system F family protein [Sedimentisphaerales bacterium]|nr:type II secretion system F family protein [Sedimentisphaerales bacterium]